MEQGKKRQKDKWFHFHAASRGGGVPRRGGRVGCTAGKSYPWTNASLGGNFDGRSAPLVHTNFSENEAKGALVHTNFRDSYGPMAPKPLWKFWSTPASVHRGLLSARGLVGCLWGGGGGHFFWGGLKFPPSSCHQENRMEGFRKGGCCNNALSFLCFFWKKARKTTKKNKDFFPTDP